MTGDMRVPSQVGPLVPLAALAYAVAVVLAVDGTPVGTSYHAESSLAAAADLVAGLALLTAGVTAVMMRTRSRAGALAALAGVVWFAPDWEAWTSGSAVVRTLGMLAAPFAIALLFDLVLGFPSGRLTGAGRWAVRAVYASAAIVCVGRGLVRDPFLDPECWRNCTENAFLVHADPSLARALDALERGTALAAGVVMAGVAAVRLASAGATATRVLRPVVLPGLFVGVTAAAYGAFLLLGPAEDPGDSLFADVFLARSAAVLALALGLGWSVWQARRARSAVVGLAAELEVAPTPGSLRTVLAKALGDPELLIAYWLPHAGGYVDAQGRPIQLPPVTTERARTPILRDGREVAVVVHDATSLEPAELQHEVGAAARLAVENEQLAAAMLAQLGQLRESRARIVETGDSERRRLERDLHDGAQQRLLTLTYRLRLARATAASGRRADLADSLGDAVDQALEALATLRKLAHGIYPAVLAESGLLAALWTLSGDAPLPVELDGIDEVDGRRYPPAVEAAAYLAVHAAVRDAARRGASHAAVHVRSADGRLTVEVRDDAAGPALPSPTVADRIGALGGQLDARPSLLRAEMPCV